jgi:hypothetical protein
MEKESNEGGGKLVKGKYDEEILMVEGIPWGKGITIIQGIFGCFSQICTGVEFCSRIGSV